MSDRSSPCAHPSTPTDPAEEQGAQAAPAETQGDPAPLAEATPPEAPTDAQGEAETPATEEVQDEGEAPPAPSATLAEANRTREAYSALCADQAEVNFRKGALAAKYLAQFLATSPAKARRSTAVENLAEEEYLWDEVSMSQPRDVAMRRMKERVNLLLRVNAVVNLLGDGRDVEKDASGAKNRGSRRRKKGDPVAWSTLSELAPLVWREDDEHREAWHTLASVQDDAIALVNAIAKEGLTRKDVAALVAKLALKDAEQELTAAKSSGEADRIKAAERAVEKWGGKVEREAPPAPQQGKGEKDKDETPPATDAGPQSKDDKGKDTTPPANNAPPPGDCRQDNLLKSLASATPKDSASVIAQGIRDNGDPIACLYEVLADLLDSPPKGMSGGEVLFAVLRAGQDAYPADSPEGIALANAITAAQKPANKPIAKGKGKSKAEAA